VKLELTNLFAQKRPPLIGVDISASSIKVLELHRSGEHYRVERYAVEPHHALLISNSGPFLKAAERLGINTAQIPKNDEGVLALERLLETLAEAK